MLQRPEPDLSHIEHAIDRQRALHAISCTDSDELPRVEGAGELLDVDGTRMQRMHNGLLIEADIYGGPWNTQVIRSLRGVHEPQEEVAFDRLIRVLDRQPGPHRMIEFGSFWAYYSMWFASELADSSVLAMEPDLRNLGVGQRNVAANGLENSIEFVRGAVGSTPGAYTDFVNESDGETVSVEQFDLESLMARKAWDRVDIVLIDIQGFEMLVLERARPILESGGVRFIVVSTHHHSISDDPLTHQRVLAFVEETGGHIIAEHTVPESFSGDGLVVASYDDADADLVVPVSYSRAKNSLFGEVEPDLAASWDESEGRGRRIAELEEENARVWRDLLATRAGLAHVEDSVIWRGSAPIRALYRRARGR